MCHDYYIPSSSSHALFLVLHPPWFQWSGTHSVVALQSSSSLQLANLPFCSQHHGMPFSHISFVRFPVFLLQLLQQVLPNPVLPPWGAHPPDSGTTQPHDSAHSNSVGQSDCFKQLAYESLPLSAIQHQGSFFAQSPPTGEPVPGSHLFQHLREGMLGPLPTLLQPLAAVADGREDVFEVLVLVVVSEDVEEGCFGELVGFGGCLVFGVLVRFALCAPPSSPWGSFGSTVGQYSTPVVVVVAVTSHPTATRLLVVVQEVVVGPLDLDSHETQ